MDFFDDDGRIIWIGAGKLKTGSLIQSMSLDMTSKEFYFANFKDSVTFWVDPQVLEEFRQEQEFHEED